MFGVAGAFPAARPQVERSTRIRIRVAAAAGTMLELVDEATRLSTEFGIHEMGILDRYGSMPEEGAGAGR